MSEIDGNVVSLFTKNAQEAIGVSVCEWQGKPRIDIRTYVQAIGEESLLPTKKGISLPIDLYQQLLDGVKRLGDVMSNEKVVARIEKSKREEIRIGVTTFRSMPLIYLRSFTLKKGDEVEWIATKRGISLRVDLYPRLLESIEALGGEIDKL